MKKIKRPAGRKQWAVTAAVTAALSAAVISAAVYIINKDSLTLKEPVRVSMMGENQDFFGDSTLRLDKVTEKIDLENGPRRVALQGVPVYSREEEALTLSTRMIYTNFSNGVLRRVNYFARVEKDGGVMKICTDGRHIREVGGGYLHDGKNVYLFLEPVTVAWGEKSLSLAPLSYMAVFDGQGFYYYSYEDENGAYVSLEDESVTAGGNGYMLDLTKDMAELDSGKHLLLPPEPEAFDPL